MDKQKRLIIIDSNSVIHRAFHALPRLTTKKGELVNALYGFLLVFLKTIKEFQPGFVIACFDFPAPTFRHKKFKKYKAKRPPAPEELYSQIPKVKQILKAFNVPIFEKKGFEADDIIGTISKKFPKKQIFPKIEVIIISGDLDTLQLVNSRTKIYLLKKGVKNTVLYDEKEVEKRYKGLKPGQLIDYRALRGDPSDNIPGVSGVGEKTATHLLKKFKTLESIYDQLEKNTGKTKNLKSALKEKILQQKDQAFLSRELAEIKEDVSVDLNLKEAEWGDYDIEKITNLLEGWDFQTLVKRLTRSKIEAKGKNLKLW